MIVRVPVGAMFPLVERIARMVVRHVIVIVAVRLCLVSMLGLPALAFGSLDRG